MSDTYDVADQGQFNNTGKGMKSKKNKSFGIEHGPMGQDGGNKEPEHSYDPEQDHEAKADADTLHRAQEIKGDDERHQKATYHLAKREKAAKDAHKDSRKHLEKRVKKGLKSAFPQGQTFGQEAEKEQAGTKEVEGEY